MVPAAHLHPKSPKVPPPRGFMALEASNMSYLSIIYNQPIKSTIHLFGEVEANALYLKKKFIKDKTKNTKER